MSAVWGDEGDGQRVVHACVGMCECVCRGGAQAGDAEMIGGSEGLVFWARPDGVLH